MHSSSYLTLRTTTKINIAHKIKTLHSSGAEGRNISLNKRQQ
jgi:hypothetical protein